jgi:hypothetical protein
MRTRHAVVALALLVAASATATPANAALDLLWSAPPECPSRDDVQNRLRAVAGSRLDQTSGLSAEGRISRVDGRFQLTLLLRDSVKVRKRVIESDSCAALAGAAAVTLSLLLGIDARALEPRASDQQGVELSQQTGSNTGDQGAGERDEASDAEANGRRNGAPGGRADRPAERSPALSEDAVTPDGSAAKRRWAVAMRAPVVVADLGPLPHPALGLGLGVGMRYESWRVLLAGNLFAAQTVNVPDQGSALGAELKRMTGQIVICRGSRWRRFEVSPCLGLALEHMSVRGFGEGVSPSTSQAVWPAPSMGAVAHWHAMESLAFFTGATACLELSRPHVVIEGLWELAQLSRTAVGLAAGLEWSF